MLHPMSDDSALRTAIRIANRTRVLNALVATVGLSVVLFALLGVWPLVVVKTAVLLTATLLVMLDQRRHSGALWRMLVQREREARRAVDAIAADLASSKELLAQQGETLRAVNATVTDIASGEQLLTKQAEVLQAVNAVAAEVTLTVQAADLTRQALETEQRYQADERRKQHEFRRLVLDLTSRQRQDIEALLQLYAKFQPTAFMPQFEQWPPDPTSVLELCSLVLRHRPTFVLELGAGVSTIWLGHAMAYAGDGRVVSLEHRADRVGWVNDMINSHGITTVCEARPAPITDVRTGDEAFGWYDTEMLTDLKDIDFVIANGPTGDGSHDGRYPALPMLLDRLASGALIAVANVDRPGQLRTADLWLREHPELSAVTSTPSQMAVLRYSPVLDGQTADLSSQVEL